MQFLLGTDTKKQDLKKLIVGDCQTEASEIADQFNHFFCSVGHGLDSQLLISSVCHDLFRTS